jgi:hypothetical protein
MLPIRALAITCTLLSSAGLAGAAAAPLRIYESPSASATTEGDVVIATDPDTAFRAAIDSQHWPQIFPDVRQAIVTGRHGADVSVMCVHTDGSRAQMHFTAQPATRTLWLEQVADGATVSAEIRFAPGAQPNTTLVHSLVHAKAGGIASMFAGDKMREMRQSWLRADLTHLRAFFTKR